MKQGEMETLLTGFHHPQEAPGESPGKCLIVEVKAERERNHPVDGEKGTKAMAVRRWEKLNPDRLRYEMIFTDTDVVGPNQTQVARRFVEESAT